jgi:hypothetical protein
VSTAPKEAPQAGNERVCVCGHGQGAHAACGKANCFFDRASCKCERFVPCRSEALPSECPGCTRPKLELQQYGTGPQDAVVWWCVTCVNCGFTFESAKTEDQAWAAARARRGHVARRPRPNEASPKCCEHERYFRIALETIDSFEPVVAAARAVIREAVVVLDGGGRRAPLDEALGRLASLLSALPATQRTEPAVRLDVSVPDTSRLSALVDDLSAEINTVVRGISVAEPHRPESVEQTAPPPGPTPGYCPGCGLYPQAPEQRRESASPGLSLADEVAFVLDYPRSDWTSSSELGGRLMKHVAAIEDELRALREVAEAAREYYETSQEMGRQRWSMPELRRLADRGQAAWDALREALEATPVRGAAPARNWEREVGELAHALGIESATDGRAAEPGPLADMLDEVARLQDSWWQRYVDFVRELSGRSHEDRCDQECGGDTCTCLIGEAGDVVMGFERRTPRQSEKTKGDRGA